MSLIVNAGVFILGLVLGIGAALFYLRWKMRRQLGDLEEQMGQMMDMTEGLDEMVPEQEEEADTSQEGSSKEE